MDRIRQDIVAAWRHLRAGRSLVAIAVLVMAIGIGANATIFSLFGATRLPFPDLDRLVIIQMVPSGGGAPVPTLSVPEYLALQERHRGFAAVGALLQWPYNLGAARDGEPAERLAGFRYTDSLFAVLGLRPQQGRGFVADETRLNAPPGSALISDRLWRGRFNADPAIVGRSIRIDDVPTTVVGVMPAGFKLYEDAEPSDVWTPLPFVTQQLTGSLRFVTVLARLEPGVSVEQAQASLDTVAAELARTRPAANGGWRMQMQPLNDSYFGDARRLLAILQAAVGLVLLIACSNVAGLLLIRATSRRQEIATRYALGAARIHILRQLLTESALIALAGGLLGLAFAWAGLRFVDAADIAWLSRLSALTIDWRGIALAAGLSFVTGVALGLAPAFHAAGVELAAVLRSARGTGGVAARWLQNTLVVAQVAIALVLLIGGALLVRNLLRLERADLGADTSQVLSFETRLPQERYQRRVGTFRGFTLQESSPDAAQLFDRLFRRLQEVPGAMSVAGINLPPLGGAPSVPFAIDGRGLPAPTEQNPQLGNTRADHYMVTPDYFQTMRIQLRRGRDIAPTDGPETPWVVIINETAARQYWPNEDPIGKRIRFALTADEQPREVIGIVGDVTFNLQNRVAVPTMFTARLQQPLHSLATYGQRTAMTYVVRLAAPADVVIPSLRRAVAEIAPQTPVAQVTMLDAVLAQQVQTPRFYMLFVAGFGGVALLLATLGLYGVISYSVAQRRREIALRIALGGNARHVATLVLSQALILAGTGLVVGIAVALGLTRFLRSVLWEIDSTDPSTFSGVAALLAVVTLCAALIPTVRALRTDPRAALTDA